MKNVSKFIGIAFLAFTAFSCSNDDETGTPQLETIAEIAQQNPDLSILVDALVRTNLVDTFNGTGSFTVFDQQIQPSKHFWLLLLLRLLMMFPLMS